MGKNRLNPIELYEGAVQQILPTVARITPSQYDLATPCTEWNVQGLINHNIGVQNFTHAVINKGEVDPSIMGNVNHPLPSEGAESALRSITDSVLSTLKSMDIEQIVETPFGPMPAGQFLMIPIADLVVHTWDLAKPTGQNTTLDSGLSEVCLEVIKMSAPRGREGGFFGPEISVTENATTQDKLLAMSGRQP